MHRFGKDKLKRSNFAATVKSLKQSVPVLTDAKPKLIPTVSTVPPWVVRLPELKETVLNILKRACKITHIEKE
jgi:hypothetical protein